MRYGENTSLTNGFVALENWKNKAAKSLRKGSHLNSKVLKFPMRYNVFGVIDPISNRNIFVSNTCPINSLLHGLAFLELSQNYLTKIKSKSTQPEIINLAMKLAHDSTIDNNDFYEFIETFELATSRTSTSLSCYGFISVVIEKVFSFMHYLTCDGCGTRKNPGY